MPSTEYGNALELARQVDAFFEADTAGYMRMFTPRVPEFRVAAEHMYPYGATEFVERYGDGVTYPVERLVPLVERATDIRLQLWYIMYDLGLSNRDYDDVINADPSL
ncbi:MAG: hypothetical protein QOH14_402, partial [Pseudonocardiales bacterium]|nr:hypothetical protein [Pseudonocardiales bacterium]